MDMHLEDLQLSHTSSSLTDIKTKVLITEYLMTADTDQRVTSHKQNVNRLEFTVQASNSLLPQCLFLRVGT